MTIVDNVPLLTNQSFLEKRAKVMLVSFTNPLAAGSGLVERTPKKVEIWVQRPRLEKKTHCGCQVGHIIGTVSTWIFRKCLRKKIFVHNFCHNRQLTILLRFRHSPPPISVLDFTGFVGFLFTSHHICSKWQCSEPRYHVLQRILFKFQHTLLPGSEWGEFGDLQIKFCACITWQCHLCRHDIHCTPQLIVYLDFLWNITAVVSEYCQHWKWEFTDWGWMTRGVEPIPSYFRGEPRSRTPMLGFWPSTLHVLRPCSYLFA